MQKQDQMGYLGIGTLNSLINGKKSEQKYFDTGVIMIDSDYLMEKKEALYRLIKHRRPDRNPKPQSISGRIRRTDP